MHACISVHAHILQEKQTINLTIGKQETPSSRAFTSSQRVLVDSLGDPSSMATITPRACSRSVVILRYMLVYRYSLQFCLTITALRCHVFFPCLWALSWHHPFGTQLPKIDNILHAYTRLHPCMSCSHSRQHSVGKVAYFAAVLLRLDRSNSRRLPKHLDGWTGRMCAYATSHLHIVQFIPTFFAFSIWRMNWAHNKLFTRFHPPSSSPARLLMARFIQRPHSRNTWPWARDRCDGSHSYFLHKNTKAHIALHGYKKIC